MRELRQRAGVQFGKTFDHKVTIEEAFEEAGMNYNVEKQQLVRLSQDQIDAIMRGEPINVDTTHIIKSNVATIRTDSDTTLGVVGSKYGVCQNSKALEFIDFVTDGQIGRKKAIVDTCGVLDGGNRVYVQVRMPEVAYLDDAKQDAIVHYLTFTNAHDGTGAVTCFFTPIRIYCQNTLTAALRLSGKQNIGKIVFKHTAGIDKRMDFEAEVNRQKAIECLKLNERCSEEYIANLLRLKNEKLANADMAVLELATRLNVKDEKMVKEILSMKSADNVDIATRTKNNINALMDSIHSGIGQEQYRGTKLWLANGVTTFFQNDYKYKSDEDMFDSINGGHASGIVDRAFDIIPALAA